MSFLAVDNAAKLTGITSTEKLVLMILCTFHNGDKKSPRFNQCNPSHKTIADKCGLTKTPVKVALRALKAKGIIDYEVIKVDGVFTSCSYDLRKLLGGAVETLGGAVETLGGAVETLGGGAVEAYKASNSFYPVKEEVSEAVKEKEHCAKNAQSDSQEKKLQEALNKIAELERKQQADSATKPEKPKKAKKEKPKSFDYRALDIPDFIDKGILFDWLDTRKATKPKSSQSERVITAHIQTAIDLHSEGYPANAVFMLALKGGENGCWTGLEKQWIYNKMTPKQKSPDSAENTNRGLQVITSSNSGINYATQQRIKQPASATAQIDAGRDYLKHRYDTTGQLPVISDDF